MGGRRCVFRNCEVSTTRNPGMHFFCFPRGGKSLNDWVRFSGFEEYFKLSDTQRRNKAVCARHFKTSCFMNFKQDRLIPTAVPTITRLNSDYALDYGHDLQTPKIINISRIGAEHLIPPPGFEDPQCFNTHDLKFGAEVLKHYSNIKSDTIAEDPLEKLVKIMKNQVTQAETEDMCTEGFQESDFLANDDASELVTCLVESDWSSDVKPEACANCLMQQARIQELETILESKNSELNSVKANIKNGDGKLVHLQHQIKLFYQHAQKNKLQLVTESKRTQQLTKEINDLNSKYNELQLVHNELKKQHTNLIALLEKQDSNSASKEETPEPKREIVQPQSLSKQQLFNGIRRYLSPTMIALLRMQLSSSSMERKWKTDEKRVATDLLGLGEQVYKYFTDEWLIRLPGISSVSDWRNQVGPQDEEDEL